MHSPTFISFFTHLSLVLLIFTLTTTVSAQSNDTTTTTPTPQPTGLATTCFQTSCKSLFQLLQTCNITIEPSTGNMRIPVDEVTHSKTDRCLCKQPVVDAYDRCFTCRDEHQGTTNWTTTRFSTKNLVDSCNLNFGKIVSMPSTSAAPRSFSRSSLLSSAILGLFIVLISVVVVV
ncbi:hypothetical protein BGX29_009541 [Mortierella sp. GBA35]|nr:hypothetical protein BGX29_009541 [Mortierella sp. GBA35]